MGDEDAQLQRVLECLHQRFGITSTPIVHNKVRATLEKLPVVVMSHWIGVLESSPANHPESLALVETLTVHETYFFRDLPQIEQTRAEIRRILEIKRQSSYPSFRIWSAACSSGEELTTLAIVTLEELTKLGEAVSTSSGGIEVAPRWNLDFFGSDVSRQVLRLAQDATYRRVAELHPFRATPRQYMRFFEFVHKQSVPGLGVAEYFEICGWLRRYMRFGQFNLMSAAPPVTDVDIVFCRNVLIYIDNDYIPGIQQMLLQSLNNDGILGLGPADTSAVPSQVEAMLGPNSVLYRKVK